MHSIQARLNLGLVAVLVLLFSSQWFVVVYSIEHLTDEYLHTQLDHDAENLLSALGINPDGSIHIPTTRISGVYRRPFSGHYFRIEVEGKILRSRSLWDQDLNYRPVDIGQADTQITIGPLDQEIMLRVAAFERQGKKVLIATAHEISDLREDMRELRTRYGAISFGALFILIVLQMVVINRGFHPVEIVRMQLHAMGRGEMSHLNEQVPTEIKPLVSEINRLLGLLAQRLQRSRNAVGNLAHALKAPLTVIHQLANSDAFKGAPQIQQQLLNQAGIMRSLVERELKRARIAGSSSAVQRFNPAKDVPPLVEMLESVYRQKDLAMDINYPEDAITPLDREDIMELLGNLLENACKWAKRQIRMNMYVGRVFVVTVEDDGPGVPAEKLDTLTQRGVRIDESTAGHGLGLSIVQETVAQYNGELKLGQSPRLGGFMVTIRIPLTRE